jgi:hypothetical protein
MADDFWQNDPVVAAAPPAAAAPRVPTDVSIRIRPVPADASAAPPAEDWWHGDPVVSAADQGRHGTAADIALSTGTGLAKGTEALLGFPGDAANLLAKGSKAASDYIADNLGVDKGPDIAKPIVPTSDIINKMVEGVTGPMHQPETTPGKYAETIGEFVPGAVAMGPGEGVAGALSNVGKLAAIPGAASEALGSRVEGTWLEPYARLLGALGGGTMGAAGSKVGEIMANRAAAAKGAAELGDNIPPAAVRKLAQNYEADELTPQAIAQKQAELGPQAMTLDMGRQMQGRAEAIASQPGKGQNTVLDAVEGRTGPFGAATAQRVGNTLDQVMGPSQDVVAVKNAAVGNIGDMLDQTLGPSPDIVATRNGINAAVDKHASPLYKSVMDAHPVVDVPSSITSRPVVAQAMKDAEQLAKNHGENITGTKETKTILSGPGYHIADDVENPAKTSLRYWDYVKKALDSRINGMMKTGGIQDLDSAGKADLGGLMDAKKTLVNHLDNVTDGAYAVARRASATKFQVNDAIDLGRSALNTKLLPEELGEHMGGMSIPERAGVQLGMRREMQRIIDTAPDDAGAARKMLDTNQNRQKITQVFGKPAADAIDRWIGVHDALATGRSALNTNLLPEELAEKMRPMGVPERTLLRTGMRREIDRIMDAARNDGAAARRLLDTNQNREKIELVFGKPAADAVDKRIAAETQFQEATNKISSNSRTAVRQQLMKDTEAPSIAQPPTANIPGLMLAGVRRGREYLGDMSLDRTRQGLGDLLTRQGNDIPTLAKVLAQYNTARAANAATPMGTQAGRLASVIASQAPGQFSGFLPGPRQQPQ